MIFFNSIKLKNLAWSLRRIYVPVDSQALVLEVGSGGNPFYRSNILLDSYLTTRERHWAPLVIDRPFVLGFVERLPFKDKQFDFVIASHVLEHSPDPVQFLNELQRVAKSGYIEVPDAFMERVNPYLDHHSEITLRGSQLIIRKKTKWCVDDELVELYEHKVKSILTKKTMRNNPFEFHVRYFWSGFIDYKILNPNVNSFWHKENSEPQKHVLTIKEKIYSLVLSLFRILFSQRKRNKSISILELVVCPVCHSSLELSEILFCSNCNHHYKIFNGIPDFTKVYSA